MPSWAMPIISKTKKAIWFCNAPISTKKVFIGPVNPNKDKNKEEKAEAMIRLGKYITDLKKPEHFRFKLRSENHAANRSERRI